MPFCVLNTAMAAPRFSAITDKMIYYQSAFRILCAKNLFTIGIIGKGPPMTWYERLHSLRIDHDLTEAQVGAIIGIAQSSYSDYETGKSVIPYDRLISLAQFYDVSMDYISGASDIRKPFETL